MSNSIDERQERQAPTSLCHRQYNNLLFVIIVPLSVYERQLGQVTPWALFYQDFLALTAYLDNIQPFG